MPIFTDDKFSYHKTYQYRNVVKLLSETTEYIGTVKLHGTNANIRVFEDGTITLHSKNNTLATISPDGTFNLIRDNYNFAQSMYGMKESLYEAVAEVVSKVKGYTGDVLYPITISGEWCGQGIQKGVGISFLPKRSLFVFALSDSKGYLPVEVLDGLFDTYLNGEGIYSITDFPTYHIKVDPSFPSKASVELEELTLQVEEECPVAKVLGLASPEGCRIGEGIVWTPASEELVADTETWFKTKGKKHTTSKVKAVASVDPEVVASVEKFTEYALTSNRLEQGLKEVGLDIKLTGKFIGWVNRDIYQEESDVLAASGLTMKQVGSALSNKAREFYMNQLSKGV